LFHFGTFFEFFFLWGEALGTIESDE